MTSIRVIFDGKNFVPQEPVSLPKQAEAVVVVDQNDPAAKAKLDAEIRAYYTGDADSEDDAWGQSAARNSSRAWEEE